MMIKRDLSRHIRKLAASFPVLSLTGPRQSGKTTLVRALFPKYEYVNLENVDDRLAAEEDPVRFLRVHAKSGVIIDEVQKAPELFSYLQSIVDESGLMGRYVLTGSQNFLLLEKISQSLAGRAAILHLMPFTLSELHKAKQRPSEVDEAIFRGSYPTLYDRKLSPPDYFPSYIQTYIERDVRSIANIGDLSTFQRFIRLCAGRVGQLVNLSSIGNELGVNYKTVRSWISILEASFIVFLLSPHHQNYNKRLVKQHKLYFYDTGLLCSLLGIERVEQIASHYLRGQLFESLVVSEYTKLRYHSAQRSNAYFWRDNKGHEVDLLLEHANTVTAVEIKSTETLRPELFRGLSYYQGIANLPQQDSYLIYGGSRRQSRKYGTALSWKSVANLNELG